MNHLLLVSKAVTFFGAPPISYSEILSISQKVQIIGQVAFPIVFIFAVIELFVIWKDKQEAQFNLGDCKVSLLLLLGYIASHFLTKTAMFVFIIWIYNHIPWRMEYVWWYIIPFFVLHDYCSYWMHRITHERRIWWTTHVPHHSGNYFNLWINFRLSWIEHVRVLLFIPVILTGIHPLTYFFVHQINALLQYWLHTEYIKKMPAWFEYIFVTPSHHRVHHARNPQYINKNYGNTFILWDRLHNTFIEEQEKPEYGLVVPDHSKNAIHIVFKEVFSLWRDLKNENGIIPKLKILLAPPK